MGVSSHQAPLPFPRDILFDAFRASMARGTNRDANRQVDAVIRTADALDGPMGAARFARVRQQMMDQMVAELDRTKVYVLTPDAVACVLATANRLSQHQAVPGPLEPPVLPMWIECEGGQITTDSGLQVAAFWLHPGIDTEREVRRMGHFGVVLVGHDVATHGILAHATEPESFEYTRATDTWYLHLRQGCTRSPGGRCPLARINPLARENALSGDPDKWVTLEQHRDAAEAQACGCRCYAYGQDRAHLVWTLLQMLRAEGATHTVVDRRQSLSVRVKRSARAREQQHRAEWNAAHPVYVRISLNHRMHVRRTQTPAGSTLSLTEMEGHTTQVVGHWRLLIPGEGRPWKGERPRVVWVTTYQRYVHGTQRVRYHVVP